MPVGYGPRALTPPPSPKNTQRGEQPPAEEELPREGGQPPVSPAVSPCHAPVRGLVPLAGSELGKGGKVEESVQAAPGTELSPVWGVSSLPVPAGIARPRAAGRRRKRRVAVPLEAGPAVGAELSAQLEPPSASPLLQDCPP